MISCGFGYYYYYYYYSSAALQATFINSELLRIINLLIIQTSIE